MILALVNGAAGQSPGAGPMGARPLTQEYFKNPTAAGAVFFA